MDKRKIERQEAGVREDVAQSWHRSDCDKEVCYFWGTESKGESVLRVYRCACGASESRTDVATGEILERKVA